MAFDFGAAGGGAAEGLEQVLRRLFLEAQQRQQAELARESMGVQRRGQDLDAEAARGQLGLGQRRIGLDEKKHAQDVTEYTEGAPLRAATLKHVGAQTADLDRQPLEQADARAHQGMMQERRTLDEEKLIKARGDQGVREARIRAANAPPIRILTTDEQGNAVTKVMPRSEATGQEFAAAPTAEQRNRQSSSGRAAPVLNAISDLSERINTGQGAIAKVAGAVERAKAQANLNDDISEYEAVVSGFTPLLARAVGHTGVLTEQDVQSVRKMLPQPGDSKSVRDRKIQRVQSLMGDISGPSAPGKVTIKSIQEIK